MKEPTCLGRCKIAGHRDGCRPGGGVEGEATWWRLPDGLEFAVREALDLSFDASSGVRWAVKQGRVPWWRQRLELAVDDPARWDEVAELVRTLEAEYATEKQPARPVIKNRLWHMKAARDLFRETPQ
jgi:hypothetical protein